jgi:hypothetical protein
MPVAVGRLLIAAVAESGYPSPTAVRTSAFSTASDQNDRFL